MAVVVADVVAVVVSVDVCVVVRVVVGVVVAVVVAVVVGVVVVAVVVGVEENRKVVSEGITYFDHPDNPRYPTFWHVRQDGWMGASFGMQADYKIETANPLTLRYLLHAHSGVYETAKATSVHENFAKRSGFLIRKPKTGESHRQFEVERISVAD